MAGYCTAVDTTVAFWGACILFIFGCLGVLVPFVLLSPPPGMTHGQFLEVTISALTMGLVMIGISICLGVLAEISRNIAKNTEAE